MIVSDDHRYVFVELPRTGSSAIARELRLHYGGREFLKKHATYRDFLSRASKEQRKYFVFSSIRNPLDKTVSLYYKYQSRHSDLYTNQQRLKQQNLPVRMLMKAQFQFVTGGAVEFEEFFMNFYRLPYNDWASLDHARFDRILRFENLEEDFAEMLGSMGIQPVRSLPAVNVTSKQGRGFWGHYERPDVRQRAIWVFGPYMQKWGYEFPSEWQATAPSSFCNGAFHLANVFRQAYWRYFR